MAGILTPIVGIISYIVLASIGLLISLFTHKGADILHSLGRLWSRIIFLAAGIRLHIRGQANIPRGEPAVFASNHQSQFDIPALYLALPIQFRFVVKQELFRIPLFGQAMKRAGYVPIDRSGGKNAVKSLREAVRRIQAGASVVVFPEGTRSPDGRLLPFKGGVLLLALRAGVPIVPVGIRGSHKVLPKGSLWVRSGTINVSIGIPIDTREYQGRGEKERLVKRVQKAVAELVDQG